MSRGPDGTPEDLKGFEARIKAARKVGRHAFLDLHEKHSKKAFWTFKRISIAAAIVALLVALYATYAMSRIAGILQEKKACKIECLKSDGESREPCFEECTIRHSIF